MLGGKFLQMRLEDSARSLDSLSDERAPSGFTSSMLLAFTPLVGAVRPCLPSAAKGWRNVSHGHCSSQLPDVDKVYGFPPK
jgi:hypothetical protein